MSSFELDPDSRELVPGDALQALVSAAVAQVRRLASSAEEERALLRALEAQTHLALRVLGNAPAPVAPRRDRCEECDEPLDPEDGPEEGPQLCAGCEAQRERAERSRGEVPRGR